MIDADFFVKQGDLLPILTATLIGDDDQPIDLSHTTVYFNAMIHGSDRFAIHALAQPDPDQITKKGLCSYHWVQGDTDISGIYDVEFEILMGGDLSIPLRVPNDSYKVLLITSKAGG